MTYELFISLSSLCPGEDPFYHPPGAFDPPEPLYASTEYQPLALDNSGVLFSDHFGDVISEFPEASGSSADWEFSFPVLENVDSGGGPGESKKLVLLPYNKHTKTFRTNFGWVLLHKSLTS